MALVLGYAHQDRREESACGFEEQMEPRLPFAERPSLKLMSEPPEFGYC